MLLEDVINVLVKVDNINIHTKQQDEEDNIISEVVPEAAPPMPDKHVPEEERIVDVGDPVVQTVIEMCRKLGIKSTINTLISLTKKNTLGESAKVKLKQIVSKLKQVKL